MQAVAYGFHHSVPIGLGAVVAFEAQAQHMKHHFQNPKVLLGVGSQAADEQEDFLSPLTFLMKGLQKGLARPGARAGVGATPPGLQAGSLVKRRAQGVSSCQHVIASQIGLFAQAREGSDFDLEQLAKVHQTTIREPRWHL